MFNQIKKKIMKKYLLTLVVMALFSIGFAASEEDKTIPLSAGEYEIKDSRGTVWHINLMENYEVTLKSEGMSDDEMFYGKWSGDILSVKNYHSLYPPIYFPVGDVSGADNLQLVVCKV